MLAVARKIWQEKNFRFHWATLVRSPPSWNDLARKSRVGHNAAYLRSKTAWRQFQKRFRRSANDAMSRDMNTIELVCGAGIVSGKEVVSLLLAQGLRDAGWKVE